MKAVNEEYNVLLQKYMDVLRERYANTPAKTYVQIETENRDIPFSQMRLWIKELYGITTAQHLLNESIIADCKNELSDEELLSNLLAELRTKYGDKPASTVAQIKRENRHLPINRMHIWTQSVAGLTPKDYLVKEGIILDLKSNYITSDLFFDDVEKAYMTSALTSDFYFIDDVRLLYADRFNNGDINRINSVNLRECGYLFFQNYIIKNQYSSAEEYFEKTLRQKDLFDLHDFDKRLIYDRTFRQTIDNLCYEYDYFEYENWKYISIDRCKKVVSNISKTTVYDFIDDALDFLKNNPYITVRYMMNHGYTNILSSLGFSDFFCSSILKNSRKMNFFKLGDSIVFNEIKESSSDKTEFVISMISPSLSIELDDVVDVMKNDYGIFVGREQVVDFIKESSLYYDKTMDKIYINKDCYYDEL